MTKSMKWKEFNHKHERIIPIHNLLAIDVAKSKSIVTLSSYGKILIEPYKINHFINDLTNLPNRINKHYYDNGSHGYLSSLNRKIF